MVKKLLHVFITTLLLITAGCYPKSNWSKVRIEALERNIVQAARSGSLDSLTIQTLLTEYENFADKNPSDPSGIEYLRKAADFYRYIGRPLRSITIYDKLYKNYPNYPYKAEMLFLQGFVFENEVRNTEAASVKYHVFLKEYPEHPLAKDVRISLQNLGKSPEQLVREFQEKAKQDSLQATTGK